MRLFFLTLFSFFIFATPAYAASISWDGDTDTDWCTLTNWSSDQLPTSIDDVTIDATVSVTTSGCNNGDVDFSTLTLGGVNTATLTITPNIGTAGSITIASNGTIVQDNKLQQSLSGTLLVESGGVLTHTYNNITHDYNVNFEAQTITINSGGSVDVDKRGYAERQGPGKGGDATSSCFGGGGGHGGAGGDATSCNAASTPGPAYCVSGTVNTIGSGGGRGGGGNPGSGGGLITLSALGTLTVSGTLTADGQNGENNWGGSGAGGGINLTADTVAGPPQSITLTGGRYAGNNSNGGGGGGCMLVTYTTSNTLTSENVNVAGGVQSGVKTGENGFVDFVQAVVSSVPEMTPTYFFILLFISFSYMFYLTQKTHTSNHKT